MDLGAKGPLMPGMQFEEKPPGYSARELISNVIAFVVLVAIAHVIARMAGLQDAGELAMMIFEGVRDALREPITEVANKIPGWAYGVGTILILILGASMLLSLGELVRTVSTFVFGYFAFYMSLAIIDPVHAAPLGADWIFFAIFGLGCVLVLNGLDSENVRRRLREWIRSE